MISHGTRCAHLVPEQSPVQTYGRVAAPALQNEPQNERLYFFDVLFFVAYRANLVRTA